MWIDGRGMLQRCFKPLPCIGRQLRPLQAQQQFVVDLQAAAIDVAGAGVEHVINDEYLGVQDLGLVFMDGDAATEQPAIKALCGVSRQWHIGLSPPAGCARVPRHA